MNHWQYRVVLENGDYSIREVWFAKTKGKIKYHSWSSVPTIFMEESLDELLTSYMLIGSALSKPVLEIVKNKDGIEKLKKMK